MKPKIRKMRIPKKFKRYKLSWRYTRLKIIKLYNQ